MSDAAHNLTDLRRLLAEKFPRAQNRVPSATTPLKRPVGWRTGVPDLDTQLGGGWPSGEISELVGLGHGSGSAQVVHAMLRQAAADGSFAVVVDGTDSLDVCAIPPEVLSRLLWVRCSRADEVLKAADLLLRDRNFVRVILDLKLNPSAELRRISHTVWHRFHRLVEQGSATVVIITPQPLVAGVSCRVQVSAHLALDALSRHPEETAAGLHFEVLRSAGFDAMAAGAAPTLAARAG